MFEGVDEYPTERETGCTQPDFITDIRSNTLADSHALALSCLNQTTTDGRSYLGRLCDS